MHKQLILVLAVLGLSANLASAQASTSRGDCSRHLERARTYEMFGDARAVPEFQEAIKTDASRCSIALFELSESLSRSLRFSEAQKALHDYIVSTPKLDHKEDIKDLTKLQNAADLKQRVDSSEEPSLVDLMELTKICDGFGRNKPKDALAYAERAVSLYPNSADALLLNAELLLPGSLDNTRAFLLLNQAAAIDTANPRIFSLRGWCYLFKLDVRQRSEADFREALRLSDDTEPLALKGLGYLFMFKGQRAESLAAFKKYLLTTKDDPEALAAIKRLESSQ